MPPGLEHLTMTAQEQWDFTRVRLAEEFKWRLDYIDELTHWEIQSIFAVKAATAKVVEEQKKKGKYGRRN